MMTSHSNPVSQQY